MTSPPTIREANREERLFDADLFFGSGENRLDTHGRGRNGNCRSRLRARHGGGRRGERWCCWNRSRSGRRACGGRRRLLLRGRKVLLLDEGPAEQDGRRKREGDEESFRFQLCSCRSSGNGVVSAAAERVTTPQPLQGESGAPKDTMFQKGLPRKLRARRGEPARGRQERRDEPLVAAGRGREAPGLQLRSRAFLRRVVP